MGGEETRARTAQIFKEQVRQKKVEWERKSFCERPSSSV